MKARVDRDLCVGDQTCVEICPEVFEMDDDVAVVKLNEIPDDLVDACREAAESCPVDAIIIEE